MSADAVRSVCPYCGVGCGIILDVKDGQITRVRGDKDHPANAGRLCTKGSACDKPLTSPARLTNALVRPKRSAEPVPLSLQQAISKTAERLRTILEKHGPDAISFYVSGQMSLEAQYLSNKLAKGFIKTQHIESNSRLCMAGASAGYKLSLGADAPPGSYEDFDCTNLFFVIGANMADCHPILFLRLLDRKRTGAKLIVVDPRRTATADKADLFLQIHPGTDLALLNGLLHLLVNMNAIDEEFISHHTKDWETLRSFLADYTPAYVAQVTGLPEADIHTAAQWIVEAKEWLTLWTMGLNQSVVGTWNSNAVCNLHLATGAICRPGSGPFSLTGQPNAMGGREMGYMGPGLPGQRSALSEHDRTFSEKIWNIPSGSLRAQGGLGAIGMFQAMTRGDIKACWIICSNPVTTVARRDTVISALQAAECVIVQDAFADCETGAYADIMLPAALWAEGEGVQVNSDRTLTLARKAVTAPGDAMPDWWLIAAVARAMGFEEAFSYTSASQIFDELSLFTNPATGYDIRGVTHTRLAEEGPVQWPAPPDDTSSRHPIRYVGPQQQIRFPTPDGRACFFARPFMQPDERPSKQYPFLLNTGRLQHQWHTLTKTGRVSNLNKLNPAPFIEIHPDDAAHLNIKDGASVLISSAQGEACFPAILTDRVSPGCCFAPFHWNDRFGENLAINAVTSDAVDPISLQPGYKLCAVSLELAPIKENTSMQTVPASNSTLTDNKAITLANLLNIDIKKPVFTNDSNLWVSAFLHGLQALPPTDNLPFIPEAAPLTPEQRLYLNGLLAGLYSRQPLGAHPTPLKSTEENPTKELIVCFASQTGQAEQLAHDLTDWFLESGVTSKCINMDSLDVDRLNSQKILFVVSTFGDGDAPDSGQPFWNALQDRTASFVDLQYAVIALGDSAYVNFCGFGRALDARLSALGGIAFKTRIDCEPDFHTNIEKWKEESLSFFTSSKSSAFPSVSVQANASKKPLPAPLGTRQNPVRIKTLLNKRLTSTDYQKETRQIAFSLENTPLRYSAGDALGIYPCNKAELVDQVIGALNLTPETLFPLSADKSVSLKEALIKTFDLSRPSPAMLKQLDHPEGGYLPELLLARRPDLSALEFVGLLRPLQPRLYSIASSPRHDACQVHLTVGVANTPWPGTSSSFLAHLTEGDEVEAYIQPAPHFHLPENPDVSVIMVGPGTGIAPFRGFLEDRQAQKASGRSWLFFGEQHEKHGFYYREELEAFMMTGTLDRLDTAFSRDQPERIYVQDRMEAAGADIWDWLQTGAYLYICGDAARMARDVDAALKRIIAHHGNMSETATADYVLTMLREGRYRRDVY